MKVWFAYLSHVSADRLADLLLRTLPEFKAIDTPARDSNGVISAFEGSGCRATIETHPGLAWPIEVEIHGDPSNMKLGCDNLAFGEWIVDKLGCTAVVDCGGLHNPPLSDRMVRITRDKVESVLIPDGDAAVDEAKTTFIRMRG